MNATATQTRRISDRTALRAYTRTARIVSRLTRQMETPSEIRDGYRDVVETTWMEQLRTLEILAQHPAIADLTEDEREALAA